MDAFDFQLPDNPPADMVAVAQLAASLARLTEAVDTLHQQHLALADTVACGQNAGPRKAPLSIPWPLRWADLDRDAAAQVWAWLIDWVGWAVDRYQLVEEIPACWYQHPPLIEELTALAAAWDTAYDDAVPADGPLLWHERFARARMRLRDWDDYTRCRNGTHTDRHLDLTWPDGWRETAVLVADADLTGRPSAASAGSPQEATS
ncbi:hypothetical protein GCM10020358_49390 [Amorphoplanes nipponensis]|uniref:DUF4913 domain-containing protein n=1 Tax=Actinoplanes nipponensis TaxID=135950 RepID=A0A919MPZ9_9ACTN|nr:hypothetical protein [Actinoplanes nipponensis]GIE53136.1 hypothetical protein Ani05nite_66700 [Actinoplanes nipponensis]